MIGSRIPPSVGTRVLVAVILTGTLSVLDSTLVVPLLTTIGDDLGGGSEVSWLVAGYLLTSTVTIPVWGRILDLRGERQVMWTSLIIFLVGTVAAVAAPSIEALIVARLIQGVGAGGIVPVGQAILASRCTSEERARLQVYYNVAYGAAAGLGPLIGGAIVNVSWRWAFALIIPIIFLAGALLIGPRNLHHKGMLAAGGDDPQRFQLDWRVLTGRLRVRDARHGRNRAQRGRGDQHRSSKTNGEGGVDRVSAHLPDQKERPDVT